MGPRFGDEMNGGWQLVCGEALAPVSRRDMWVLRHAARLAVHVPQLSDPEHLRSRRHVFDWLRMPLADGDR